MSLATIDEVHDVQPYRWTVEEYEKLGEQGFFQECRVELLNGKIYKMSPIGFRHAEAVSFERVFFAESQRALSRSHSDAS